VWSRSSPAVDDPNDPLLSVDHDMHIHWTAQESPHDIPVDDGDKDDLRPRAQMDDGAQVTCTNDRTLLHRYRPYDDHFPSPIHLRPAVKDAAVLHSARKLGMEAKGDSASGRVIISSKPLDSAKYVTLWSPQQIHMGDGLTNVTRFREEVITFNPNRHAPPGFRKPHYD
jgi:hypothetical protein